MQSRVHVAEACSLFKIAPALVGRAVTFLLVQLFTLQIIRFEFGRCSYVLIVLSFDYYDSVQEYIEYHRHLEKFSWMTNVSDTSSQDLVHCSVIH